MSGKCPKCGDVDVMEVQTGEDEQGNSLISLMCANMDCDHIYVEGTDTNQCFHLNYEDDAAGYWCAECGEFLGERSPEWYRK